MRDIRRPRVIIDTLLSSWESFIRVLPRIRFASLGCYQRNRFQIEIFCSASKVRTKGSQFASRLCHAELLDRVKNGLWFARLGGLDGRQSLCSSPGPFYSLSGGSWSLAKLRRGDIDDDKEDDEEERKKERSIRSIEHEGHYATGGKKFRMSDLGFNYYHRHYVLLPSEKEITAIVISLWKFQRCEVSMYVCVLDRGGKG